MNCLLMQICPHLRLTLVTVNQLCDVEITNYFLDFLLLAAWRGRKPDDAKTKIKAIHEAYNLAIGRVSNCPVTFIKNNKHNLPSL